MPQTILLALSSFRYTDDEVERALGLAREHGAKLLTVFVVDANLARYFAGSGVVAGSTLREELERGVLDDLKQQAREVLQKICVLASERGLECETILRVGKFEDEIREVIPEQHPRLMIVTRARRPQWMRRLFGSPVDRLCDEAGGECSIDIV